MQRGIEVAEGAEVIITNTKKVIEELKQRRADAFAEKNTTMLRTAELKMEGRIEAFDIAIELLERK